MLMIAISGQAPFSDTLSRHESPGIGRVWDDRALGRKIENGESARRISPARGIRWRASRFGELRPKNDRFRTIDGSHNNLFDPSMGATYTPLRRLLSAAYEDGVSALSGTTRPSPRAISNAVNAQTHPVMNRANASDFLWQWGQFLDHDIDLTDGTDPPEPRNIPVPAGDPAFDPERAGTVEIGFNRSIYDVTSGMSIVNPRQQLNEVTGWIDASVVYGSDNERAWTLRKQDGTGRLRTSRGRLLPFNRHGLPNAGGANPSLFLAGDVRANEQIGLLSMHTLFVREHNRKARRIRKNQPWLSGDRIYEKARRHVTALIQVITYQEYLPVLLGKDALAPYAGYRNDVDARISNVFSSALYRYGHSALSPMLLRVDADGSEINAGHLPLRDAFFAPQRLIDEGGIEPILRGLASQRCQEIDPYVVDDVRNFLFGAPGRGGFDLASLNIQRGRDHGLPSYNAARTELGLERVLAFSDITDDPEMQVRLAEVYDNVDDIDLWVGGLAETSRPGSMVGELIYTVLKEQFEALRDADRYWYRRVMTPKQARNIERTRLSDVIRRNTSIGDEIPDDVFHVVTE